MEWLKGKNAAVRAWAQTSRGKHTIAIIVALAIVGWALFRVTALVMQSRMQVYNPARAQLADGIPVSVMVMEKTDGVISEPLTVKNNRAYISGARMRRIAPGMRVGDGKIVSVSSNIDLDSGMHVVQTSGVADGAQTVEFRANGYFVPVHAVRDNAVFVARDGVATSVPVTVARSDAQYAYITSGLRDGDIVILSNVFDGDRVRIQDK